MKRISTVCSLTVASLLLYMGCTAEVSQEYPIGVAKQQLSIEQCEAERDACLDTMGLFGLVTCNFNFTLCAMTSEIGLPVAVTGAIEEAATCRAALDDCVRSAETPAQLTACAEEQAICVADILDIGLPDIVTGTAACVDDGIECINNAESLSDLDGCGETMAACALEEASAIVPEPVSNVVNEISACNFALDDCIREASTPAELTACGETQAACVAAGLGVDLPDVPLSEVVGCAETAIDCTLEARSISSLNECRDGLSACAADVVDALNAPDALDCELAWISCLLRNPFAFIPCAEELRDCQD